MKNLHYLTADLESPWADVHMDIHNMPFQNDTFDVVLCNHVLEHVMDDRLALKEIFRVLKPGGWAILQSPLNKTLAHTLEDPSIKDPKECERIFGQSDHLRLYGADYAQRIREAGFELEESDFIKTLTPEEIRRFALPSEETIYVAHKSQRKN